MMATGHSAMMVRMPTKGLIHMAEPVILSWKGQSSPGKDQRFEIVKKLKVSRVYHSTINHIAKRKSTLFMCIIVECVTLV